MKFLIILYILLLSTGFAKKYKASIIDDYTKKNISEVKVIIDNKDTMYSDKSGIVEFESNTTTVHIDLYKLSYKFEHYDVDLSNINSTFLLPMHPLDFHLHNIIVSGEKEHSTLDSFILSSYKLSSKEVNSNMQASFGESMQSIKGVDIRAMGSAPTRPVFRGLSNDRLKINSDGFINLDLSANSPDHNVAIDPQSIKGISILRGPKTLKYSSSSSAGVFDLDKNDIPIEKVDNSITDIKNYFHSNNLAVMNYIENTSNIYNNINIKGKVSLVNSQNINTPNLELLNSQINSSNYSIGVANHSNDNEYGIVYDYYQNEYGIPPGPVGTHPKGVNIEMFKQNLKTNYNYHFHESKYIKDVKFNYLYNHLEHNEYESSGILGARYIIQNHVFRLDFESDNLLGAKSSDFGINFSRNYFDAGAAVRTPEVIDFNYAFYLIQYYELNNFDISFALRQENKYYLTKNDESVSKNTTFIDKNFNIKTFSFSSIYKKLKNSILGVILSYDERIPTLEELYSMGPHLASYSYDIGNQNLKIEKSINVEIMYSIKSNFNKFEIENSVNLFNYYFFNFITPRNTGEIDLVKTRLPIYENQGIKANLNGFEYQLNVNYHNFILKNVIQYTIGRNLESDFYLPMIPPLKNILELKFKKEKYDISLISEIANTQDKFDEFETKTNSYIIFNLKSNYYFYLFGSQNQLVLNVRNLFNTSYRNHLSRIKEIMPEAGRNISIGLNNYF